MHERAAEIHAEAVILNEWRAGDAREPDEVAVARRRAALERNRATDAREYAQHHRRLANGLPARFLSGARARPPGS
jgi:hypothetical protein